MKHLAFTLYLVLVFASAEAQTPERALLRPDFSSEKSEIQRIPIQAQPFLSYYITQAWQVGIRYENFQIRFSEDGATWTTWQTLTQDGHNPDEEKQWVSQLNYTEATYHFYQYRWLGEQQPNKLALHFYSPDHTPVHSNDWRKGLESRAACACPQPAFESRTDWCNACPIDASPAAHEVTHLIIHHSAGTNVANDWSAIVRSIWDFHVDGRGWDDIGYNWLIDPNGVLYVGRATNVRGAHFCGNNTNTEGVCVLGDFTEITPTDTTLQTLTELWAWKSCESDLNPVGFSYHSSSAKTLPVIAGHRDGCATACPGDSFYPLLESVRESVDDFRDAQCSTVSIEDAAETRIHLFPNPTQDKLQIELPKSWQGEVALRLHSITGKILLEQRVSTQAVLDLSMQQFVSGIYLLELENAGQQRIFKVIKE